MSIAEGKIAWLKSNGTQVLCERDLVPFGVTWCKENLEKGDWALQNKNAKQKSSFFFMYAHDAETFETEVI